MNTRLEIPGDGPRQRSALGWRPFGDDLPMPAPRHPTRPARPPRAATPRAISPVPLWLPFAVAIGVGALVGLVAASLSVARSGDVPARPAPVVVSALAVGLAGSSEPWPEAVGARQAAVPAPVSPAPRTEGAPRVFAPERVSDLKANPFVAQRAPSRAPLLVFDPQRVSDLKANPYRRGSDARE